MKPPSATPRPASRLTTVLLLWAAGSSAGLAGAWYLDPYIYALAVLGGVIVSAGLVLVVGFRRPRLLVLALSCAAPSIWAVVVLRTINWA